MADLLFDRPAATDGALVFGDTGNTGTPVDVPVTISAALPGPGAAVLVNLTVPVRASFSLPGPGVYVNTQYVSGAERPVVGRVTSRWQDALHGQDRVSTARWQDAVAMPSTHEVVDQAALPLHKATGILWRDAQRMGRQGLAVRYQDGLPVHNAVAAVYSDGQRFGREGFTVRYQQAVKRQRGTVMRFQDGIRNRGEVYRSRWQDGVPASTSVRAINTRGRPDGLSTRSRYQDAIQPTPGISYLGPIVVPPVVVPCYLPNAALLFRHPWVDLGGEILFFCDEDTTGPVDPTPAQVVVPVRRIYTVINSATLRRVDGNLPLPTFNMSLSLDADSWTWQFSAALPGRSLSAVEPNSNGPIEVEAMINGTPYRFIVEKIGRERAFAQDGLRISGRGLSAELAAPYAPVQSFGNDNARSAQQLMLDVLTENGVALDWEIDWQLEDWNVPANNWRMTGSYMDALTSIAGAAGGYIQPTPATKTLKVLPRYPALPWDWGSVVPDIELPSAAATRENIEWEEKTRYDRVFVSGQGAGGRTGNVVRAGSAGLIVAADVVDPLITDPIAARQRGGAILADTGRIATYQLRTAVGVKDTANQQLGIVPPGKFLLYNDNGVTRLGITRAVSVDVQMPEAWQTITVESHESL